MIGQENLQDDIDRQIRIDAFPRFALIVGEAGSERNKVAQFIANKLGAICVDVPDVKVETIREIILNSYKVTSLTVYNIQDADSMSVQARNSLLKVTEEPPNRAYFVMTLDDENNTLPTIRSRARVFKMQPYTREQLEGYCKSVYEPNGEDLGIILKLAATPGDVDKLVKYNPSELYSFVDKVVNNIASTSGSNALKISQSIQMKDTDEKGYELRLFWRAFCTLCFEKDYYRGVLVTSQYLSQLRTRTVNRAMLFDAWVLTIRQEWIDGCI